jgi:hypothetical protein
VQQQLTYERYRSDYPNDVKRKVTIHMGQNDHRYRLLYINANPEYSHSYSKHRIGARDTIKAFNIKTTREANQYLIQTMVRIGTFAPCILAIIQDEDSSKP